MSRWAEMFAALSGGSDTVDTLRHNAEPASTLSHSVNSVAGPPEPSPAPPLPAAERAFATWREAEEERAAIVEHGAGVPRAWAEGFARLDPDRPPGDVPLKRWRLFVDDVGLFLAHPFCAVAVALGWGPHDLFGCDRDRPFARIDQAGLLWLLHSDRLVAMTENTATIETPTGTRQTYRRKAGEPGRVLAWEMASSDAIKAAAGKPG
jgi:hypothetical protein